MDVPGLDKFGRFANRRELEALKPSLEDGERVLHALEAFSGSRKGLLVATDHRVVWVVAGLITDKAQSWPYPQLQRVQVALDVDEAVITLVADGIHTVFAKCPRKSAQEFAKVVESRPSPSTYQRVRPVPFEHEADQEPEAPRTDAEERLERVERMYARGSMSEPEYRVAKRRILEHNELPVRKPRPEPPEGTRTSGEPVPLGEPGAGEAEPGTEVIHAADLPEGTSAMGDYQWGGTKGITTKGPVDTAEDPGKVLDSPVSSRRDSANRRSEVAAEPTSLKPIPSARKAPVDAATQPVGGSMRTAQKGPVAGDSAPADFQAIPTAKKGPVTFEPERAPVKPPSGAAKGPVTFESQPANIKPVSGAKKGPVEVDDDPLKDALTKPRDQPDTKKRGRVWPPLPGKED